MDTTLTIRLSKTQREALRRRAAAEGRSESALVRGIIAREIERSFDFEAARRFVGSVESEPKHWAGDFWKEHLCERN